MTADCLALLKTTARSLQAAVTPDFTGKVIITLHYHKGSAGTATITFEEGVKLNEVTR